MSVTPITFEVALKVFGDPGVNLLDDRTRACFFAVWAMLVVEFEQELEAQRAAVAADRPGVSKV
ncbi:hypothetical protein [Burkholderia contaminans]|uniref:hypothetical protein n=1 Tax=Burkholderia contaminans TaxID=488447 RepID=UPI000F57A0C2|nr:hypothetical protein [Burkholderia contaminans]RQT38378.1 hypothetical protein DF036_06870 [Burkholderia contaminans]